MNLGNQPVEVLIEDVYLLVVPSSEGTYDAAEEVQRVQAAKAERLQNAELLHIQGQAEQGADTDRLHQRIHLAFGRLSTAAGSVVFPHREGHQ